MKVIIVGPAYPYRGGIADTNHSLCRAFGELEHEASLVTFTVQYPNVLFPGKNQYTEDTAPNDLSITREINSMNPLSWFNTARFIKSQKPDLVIMRYWLPFMAPALGTIAAQIKKHTKVLAMCDNVLPHEKRFGDEALTSYFVSKASGFITLSEHVSHELKKFTKKPVLSLFHPVNSDLPSAISKASARAELGLNEEDSVVLFFGLVRAYKGLDLLIEALGNSALHHSSLKLIIAGEFYEEKSKYTELISELGIQDRVMIHDHFIPQEKLAVYFCAADLLAQTYKSASQSGVTQIAYHFNLPLLVTNVGGLTEMVSPDRVGLVTSMEPHDIAEAIKKFFDSKLAAEFKKNLAADLPNYTWTGFVKEVLAQFTEHKKTDSQLG